MHNFSYSKNTCTEFQVEVFQLKIFPMILVLNKKRIKESLINWFGNFKYCRKIILVISSYFSNSKLFLGLTYPLTLKQPTDLQCPLSKVESRAYGHRIAIFFVWWYFYIRHRGSNFHSNFDLWSLRLWQGENFTWLSKLSWTDIFRLLRSSLSAGKFYPYFKT